MDSTGKPRRIFQNRCSKPGCAPEFKLLSLPVIDGNRILVGILTKTDIVKAKVIV